MDGKKFIVGTFTGGVVYFFLGFLFYAVLLEGFFMANQGTATGVMNEEMQFWPIILGNLSWAALLTYAIQQWTNVGSMAGGARTGALIGLLMTLGFDLVMYDTTNIMNLQAALVDVLVMVFNSAIAGGIIALVAGGTEE